jgi:hypothetical protein|tara:strand:- start:194 stop:526 length:333 start_codon:yes stop_codon:yes gene_type:complete
MDAIFFLKSSASISALLTVKSSPSMEHRMDPSSEDDRKSMNSSKDLSVGSMIASSFVLGLASNRRLLTSTDDEDFVWLLNDFFCKIWSPLDEEDAEQSSDDIESVRVIMV